MPVEEFAKAAEMRALTSAVLERMQFMQRAGITFNGMRDLYLILGYNSIITADEYRDRYARGGIAGRIVEALPNATWRGGIELIEDENPKVSTPFEKAWDALEKRLHVWATLRRVDILASLSNYAVLLIGVAGDFAQELPRGRKPEDLLYLTPFGGGMGTGAQRRGRGQQAAMDGDVRIDALVQDPKDPRFGQPFTYSLKRTDLYSSDFQRPVHFTRILHVAEGCLDDEVYGAPSLERVWNLLDDLDKITGGGAEAFWLRANQGLQLDVDPAVQLSTEQKAELKDMADNYEHQMRRWMRTRGVKVKTLGSDVANFSNPADAVLTQIAGAKGIPKRILTGSEMGELASSQDRDNWKDQVNGRQTQYAGPFIVRPFVDRLIEYGYLPEPKQYEVRWAHVQTLTEQEKAEGASKWAATNAAQGAPIFLGDEIRDHWYGMPALTPEQIEKETPEPPPPEPLAVVGPDGEPVELGPDGKPIKVEPDGKSVVKTAEGLDVEMLQVLEAAIVANNTDVIDRIIGIRHAGGPGSGWTTEGGHVPGSQGGQPSEGMSHLGQMTKGPDVTPEQVAKMTAVVNALPVSFLKQVGPVNVHLTTKDLPAADRTSPGHATANYRVDNNQIKVNVAAKGKTEAALVHELGHAYQSNTEANVDGAFQQDQQRMREDDRILLKHYTINQREAFAQSVAHTFGKIRDRAEFARAFKNTIVATQAHLRARGVLPTSAEAFDEDAERWAEEHTFSSTQVQLPDALARQLLAFGQTILDEDLATDGREADIHVTAKYGLHTTDPVEVQKVVRGFGPVFLTLGELECFEGEEHDVLYARVDSPDLVRLNTLISDSLKVTDTYPEYVPHACVAYLKPGFGHKYVGMLLSSIGMTATLTELTFSASDGALTVLSLARERPAVPEAPPADEMLGILEAAAKPEAKGFREKLRRLFGGDA